MNQKLFTDWNAAVAAVANKKTDYDAAVKAVNAASVAYNDALTAAKQIKQDLMDDIDKVIPDNEGRVRVG